MDEHAAAAATDDTSNPRSARPLFAPLSAPATQRPCGVFDICSDELGSSLKYFGLLHGLPPPPAARLRIAPSWLPAAGLGLFAGCAYSRGETLCRYSGDVLPTGWAIK